MHTYEDRRKMPVMVIGLVIRSRGASHKVIMREKIAVFAPIESLDVQWWRNPLFT